MTDITAGAAPELEPTPAPEAAPAEAAPETAPSGRKPHPWTDASPHPWRRYFARSVDIFVFGMIGIVLIGGIGALVAPTATDQFLNLFEMDFVGQLISGPALIILAAPFVAVSMALSGGSFGKWLFGVRVVRADGKRLSLVQSIVREAQVMVFGMGMGVPLLCLATMWQGKETLDENRPARWDAKAGYRVTYRPMGVWQGTLMVVGGLIWGGERLLGVIERFSSLGG